MLLCGDLHISGLLFVVTGSNLVILYMTELFFCIPNLFISGKAKNCIFGNGQLKFIMSDLRIAIPVFPRTVLRGFCTEFKNSCSDCGV